MPDIELVRPYGRDCWTTLLSEQSSSGLPASVWCKARGISVTALYAWRKRLTSTATDVSSTFVEVVDLPSPRLELAIGRISIRLESGFDRRLLCDVLDVLEMR